MTVRRSRLRKDLRRSRPRREPYDRVLVVCEGSRTEKQYFLDLAHKFGLSANVEVSGAGRDPLALVHQAIKHQQPERAQREKFDQVYCVFDRDQHHHFDSASEQARSRGFKLARSWPCFEFWLLLHFSYSRKPYEMTSKSPAENCIEDLRQHFPGYEKSASGVFSQLFNRLEDAKLNAANALHDARTTGEMNPSTEVHLLVESLQELRSGD